MPTDSPRRKLQSDHFRDSKSGRYLRDTFVQFSGEAEQMMPMLYTTLVRATPQASTVVTHSPFTKK
jgi:hypothetical protein